MCIHKFPLSEYEDFAGESMFGCCLLSMKKDSVD